jgi:putative spermidine/putrescine transport system substrate-binding protein
VHETYVKAYLEPFAKLTGAQVISDSPFDYARIKAQVEARNVKQDIITGSPYTIEANCGTLFEPVPDNKLYRSGINPKYLPPNAKCAIPQTVSTFVVMYNTAMYGDDAPKSCADFFDLKRFPGKRGLWSSVTGTALDVALLGDGVPPEKLYPLDVDRALNKLATIKSDLSFFSNLAVGTEGMMNGTYGMVITSNGRAYDAVVNGSAFKPDWYCSVEQTATLGIVKGTPNLEAAYALVGYSTTPEAQSARMAIVNHNPVSTKYSLPTDPLLLSFLPPARPEATSLMNNDWWSKNFDATEQRFREWQVE